MECSLQNIDNVIYYVQYRGITTRCRYPSLFFRIASRRHRGVLSWVSLSIVMPQLMNSTLLTPYLSQNTNTLTFPAELGTLKFLAIWELGRFYCLSVCLRVRCRNHVYPHVTRIPATLSYFCKRWSLERESRKLNPFGLPTDICAFGMHAFCGIPVLRGQCFMQFGGQLQCGRRISNCDSPTFRNQFFHPFCLHIYPWYTG